MADNKIRLPSGQGGIVRYSDEVKSKITFKPLTVVISVIVIAVIVLIIGTII